MDLTQIVLKAKRTYSDASKNEKNLIFMEMILAKEIEEVDGRIKVLGKDLLWKNVEKMPEMEAKGVRGLRRCTALCFAEKINPGLSGIISSLKKFEDLFGSIPELVFDRVFMGSDCTENTQIPEECIVVDEMLCMQAQALLFCLLKSPPAPVTRTSNTLALIKMYYDCKKESNPDPLELRSICYMIQAYSGHSKINSKAASSKLTGYVDIFLSMFAKLKAADAIDFFKNTFRKMLRCESLLWETKMFEFLPTKLLSLCEKMKAAISLPIKYRADAIIEVLTKVNQHWKTAYHLYKPFENIFLKIYREMNQSDCKKFFAKIRHRATNNVHRMSKKPPVAIHFKNFPIPQINLPLVEMPEKKLPQMNKVSFGKTLPEKTMAQPKVSPEKTMAQPKASPEKTMAQPKASPEKTMAQPKVSPEKPMTPIKVSPEKTMAQPKASPEKTPQRPQKLPQVRILDKPPTLDEVLSIYKYEFLNLNKNFVANTYNSGMGNKIRASMRLIVPANLNLDKVRSNLQYRHPIHIKGPRYEDINENKMVKFLGYGKDRALAEDKLTDYHMRYAILGYTPLDSDIADEAYIVHLWGVNLERADTEDAKFVIENGQVNVMRYYELMRSMFLQLIAAVDEVRKQTNKNVILRITKIGLGVWLGPAALVYDEIYYLYRQSLAEMTSKRNWLTIYHPDFNANSPNKSRTMKFMNGGELPGSAAPELQHPANVSADPFGPPGTLAGTDSVLVIVNAWDDRSFIGNGGSEDNSLDGWIVSGSSMSFSTNYLGNSLGSNFINACYLHNAFFNPQLFEDKSIIFC